ncbi:MAG TPA: hypothetical protein VGD26_12075 [Chitinophagaceae bacterium]
MAENTRGQNSSKQDRLNERNQQRSSEDFTTSNSDHQNISSNRGGTTDMGNEASRSATGNTSRTGSGLKPKKSVTGSDYDGQLSEE